MKPLAKAKTPPPPPESTLEVRVDGEIIILPDEAVRVAKKEHSFKQLTIMVRIVTSSCELNLAERHALLGELTAAVMSVKPETKLTAGQRAAGLRPEREVRDRRRSA